MHETIENMRGDLEEMTMVIEDKKVELEMLKPPPRHYDVVVIAIFGDWTNVGSSSCNLEEEERV